MIVLVPVYWHYYGPTNFLYFCDVALFLTLAGLWLDSPLLISMCAVGILLPQAVWVLDFVVNLFGVSLIGMTDYMFKHENSLFLRGLSLFHGWLPFLLAYLVWQLGYDRRGLPAWTVLAWALILVCFFFMPPPDPNAGLTPVNINYVWGPNDGAAQTWMPPYAWLAAHDDRHAAAAVPAGPYSAGALLRRGRHDRCRIDLGRRILAAALRAPRTARRRARLPHLHRLSRARRHGDRRRRLAVGEPDRRAQSRGPQHPRRRSVVRADPPRGHCCGAKLPRLQGRAFGQRHVARDGAHRRQPSGAGRDQGGRCALSALRRGDARSAAAACQRAGAARRRLRRRGRRDPAGAARAEARRAAHHRQRHLRDHRDDPERAGQACDRLDLRSPRHRQRGGAAGDRAAGARAAWCAGRIACACRTAATPPPAR